MAYRRFRRRGAGGARKGMVRVKKSVSASGSNIYKLTRQVNRLKRSVGSAEKTLYYKTLSTGTVSTPVKIVNMCDYATMVTSGGLYGASAQDIASDKATHEAMTMDILVSLQNFSQFSQSEWDSVNFTCFLVSLRDAIGSKFNPTTGALTLTGGEDYATAGSVGGVDGGFVYLNPKIFKVHKSKRFTLSNIGVDPTATSLPNVVTGYNGQIAKQWQWRLYPKTKIVNSKGTWGQLASAVDPSKQYYVLIFNNNSAADLQYPFHILNCINRVRTN